MSGTKNISEKAYIWGHVGVIIAETIVYFVIALLSYKIYSYKVTSSELSDEKEISENKSFRKKYTQLNGFYFKKYALIILCISVIAAIINLLGLIPVLKNYDKIIIE